MSWGDFSAQALQARLEQAARIGQNVVANLTAEQLNAAKAAAASTSTNTTTINPSTNTAATNPESSSLSVQGLAQGEIERLKKMETRFVDLARAYKAIKSKQDQIEKIIVDNSSLKELKTPEQFKELESLVKSSAESFDSQKEITKLVNQINDLKIANEQESTTSADMYSAMQAKLISREEEINRLKHKLAKLGEALTPAENSPAEMNNSNAIMDQVTLKLKIRELANALKSVTAQRNDAYEKLKAADDIKTGDAESFKVQDVLSPNLSMDSLPDLNGNSSKLENEKRSLQLKLESELNSSNVLKSRVKQLDEELEKALASVTSLQTAKRQNDQTIEELREQVNSIVDEMAGLSDECDKLKIRNEELSSQLSVAPLSSPLDEQHRQEARERNANLEFRLKTVQQKLESLEKQKAQLEVELEKAKKKTVDDSETLKFKNAALESEKKITELSAQVESLISSHDTHKLEMEAKLAKFETLADKKSKDAEKLIEELDAANNQLKQLKSDLIIANGKVTSLNAQVESSNVDTPRLKKLIQELQEKLQTSQQQLSLNSEQKEKEMKSLKESVEVTSSKLATLEDQLVNANDLIKKKDSELKEKKKELDTIQKQFDTEKSRTGQLEKSLSDASSNFQKKELKLKTDIKSLEASQNDATEKLQSCISKHEEQLLKLNSEKIELESSIKKLKLEKEKSASVISKLNDRLASKTDGDVKENDQTQMLTEENKSMSATIESFEKKVSELETNILQQSSERDSLQKKLNVLAEEKTKLRENFKQITAEYEDVVAKLSKSEEHVNSLTTSMHGLEHSKNELKQTITSLQENIESLKSGLTEKNTLIKSLENEKNSLAKKSDGLQAKVIGLEESKQKSEKITAELNGKVESLDAKLLSIGLENETLQRKSDSLESDSKTQIQLQIDLESFKDELAKAKNTITMLESTDVTQKTELEFLKDQKAKITLDLEKKGKELADSIKKFDSLQASFAAEKKVLEEKLTELETQIAQGGNSEELESFRKEKDSLLAQVRDNAETIKKLEEELYSANIKLSDETEKKTKSIQLLRNSKNRILKLEGDLRTAEGDVAKYTKEAEDKAKAASTAESSLAESAKNASTLSAKVDILEAKVKQLQPITAQVDNLNLELIQERRKCTELKTETELLKNEISEIQKTQVQETEIANAELTLQVKELTTRLQAADERIEQIDADLLSSKRLFEAKCVENDNIKISISEYEAKLYENGQALSKMSEEKISLQEAANQSILLSKNNEAKLNSITEELASSRKELLNRAALCDQQSRENEKLLTELEILKQKINTIESHDSIATQQNVVDQVKMRELEEKIKQLCREKVDWVHEKDTLLQDFRMREVQLKNLNKTLKDEIRKVSRGGSASSSAANSPALSRRDSADRSPLQSTSSFPVSRSTLGIKVPDPDPEYLKNVILKFIESGKRTQRVQLVNVLGMLLKFTPEEIERAQKNSY